MSPCCTRAARICTLAHTHTQALAQTGGQPVAGSAVTGAPGCSSLVCPQGHHCGFRGGVEEAGGTRGATISRRRRESGANPDSLSCPGCPFLARGRRGHGQLRLLEGNQEPPEGGAHARGRGQPSKGKQADSTAGLPLEASFSSLGLVTFPLIDPSLLDKVRPGDRSPRRAGWTWESA
jgi:hypothetical protein